MDVNSPTIEDVLTLAEQVFEDRKKADSWLNSKVKILNDTQPMDWLDTAEGRGVIVDLLRRIEMGEFS